MAYLCVSLIGKSIQNSPRHLFSRCEVGDIFIIKDSFPFQEMITEDPTYGPDETGLGASMCDLEATKHQDGTQWDWNSSTLNWRCSGVMIVCSRAFNTQGARQETMSGGVSELQDSWRLVGPWVLTEGDNYTLVIGRSLTWNIL